MRKPDRLIRTSTILVIILTLLLLIPASAEDAEVSGTVFLDANGNGLMDADEKPVGGAELTLISASGGNESIHSYVSSDREGRYRFPSAPAGNVYLQIALPDDLLFTAYQAGGSIALPAAGSKGRTPVFSIEPGEVAEVPVGAIRQSAYLNVTAFGDENANGGRFSSEPLLRGVELALVYELDDQRYTVAEAVTDKEGFAQLSKLTPAEYRLWVRMPTPYIIGPLGQKINPFYNIIPPTDSNEGISEPFTLERSLGVGVGGVMAGSLAGRVWLDTNMNGIMEASEGGFPGVKITLTHLDLGVERTLTTTQEADFRFIYLQPGTYSISAQLPDGVMFALEKSPSLFINGFSDSQSAKVQVEKGRETILDPIGVMPSSGIAVIAFHDINVNGLPDEGEPPFTGAKAEVLVDGIAAAGSLSDSEGVALLKRVRGGDVSLRVSLPDDQIFSVSGGGDGNAFFSLAAANQVTIGKQLAHGEQMTLYAGVTIPAMISGTLFDDADLSGAFDQSENKLEGFTVQAVDSRGNIASEGLTDKNGEYLLSGLVPAEYTVRILLKSPFVFSPVTSSSAEIRNQIISQTPDHGDTAVLSVKPGQHLEHVDAGAFRSAVITGAILLGDETDGFSGALGGLPDVQIDLVDENGIAVSAYTVSKTDSQGAFSLKGALPGSYRLRFTLADGAKLSKPHMDAPSFQTDVFQVKTSDVLALEPIYAVKTGTLSGLAFTDMDSDGKFGGADRGLKGAALSLRNRSTGEVYETVSADEGRYEIGGIRPGVYDAEARLPDGYILSNSENSLAPASLTGVSKARLDFGMGTVIGNTTLAAAVPLSMKGAAFYDHDLNGRFDPLSDTPYPIRIVLTHKGTGSVFSLSADPDGVFSQSPLYPGKYELKVSLPEDHLVTAPENARQEGTNWISDIVLDQNRPNVEVALVQLSGMRGTVWNMDGSTEGVDGLAIALKDAEGRAVRETSTDSGGSFEFTRLMPVEYTLSATLSPGYRFARTVDTSDRPSVITADLADSEGSSGVSGLISLRMGELKGNQDIGIGALGKMGDLAWLDSDGDGMQDAGEPGIPGIIVMLYQYGEVTAQATTDSYGRYMITGLYPGKYTIQVTMPEELKPTVRQTVFPLVASVLRNGEGQTAYSDEVLVPSGGRNLNCDLGFVLRKEGKFPASMLDLPKKDWTQVNEQKPGR